MSEQQEMDQERAAFEAWYLREIADGQGSLIKYPNGHYINDTTMDAWYGWQARASLPVGVPDGWKLAPVEPTPEMVSAAEEAHMPFGDMDIALRMAILSAPAAAPTVKAEQVQAPSLPAAGSAVEEVEVVGYRFFHVDHGYIFRRTHIYEGNPSLEAHGLMTVAQHKRIVAQLAARDAGEVRALAAFALDLIDGAWSGGSFDGGDIQDAGVRHGLLVVEQREESCGEHCACVEYGFPAECYRLTPNLANHRKAQQGD